MGDEHLPHLTMLERADVNDPPELVLKRIAELINENSRIWLPLYLSRVASVNRQKAMADLVERIERGQQLVDGDVPLAAELLYYTDSQREAAALGMALPLYSTFMRYDVNAVMPWTVPPQRRPSTASRRWTLLGKPIDFPIGVPASALTGNAEWIGLLAGAGYNVLTFKTVRTREWQAHASPNWAFVSDSTDSLGPAAVENTQTVVGSLDSWEPGVLLGRNTANSFGVPSPSPEVWQNQVSAALSRLSDGQMLLVSVMGADYDETMSVDVLADDYVAAAKLAHDAGAKFIELNLSCPNSLVGDAIGPPLCDDHATVLEIVRRVRAQIDDEVRLVAKLAYQPFARLEALVAALGASVDGYSGINSVQCNVVTVDGKELFPTRSLAGVSGDVIHDLAKDFVTSLARIRSEGDHSFDIIGMGGVTSPTSFKDLYDCGATVVQSASGVFLDLFLGEKCYQEYGRELSAAPPVSDPVVLSNLSAAVRRVLEQFGGRLDIFTLSSALPVPALQVVDVLNYMDNHRQVLRVDNESGPLRYALNK